MTELNQIIFDDADHTTLELDVSKEGIAAATDLMVRTGHKLSSDTHGHMAISGTLVGPAFTSKDGKTLKITMSFNLPSGIYVETSNGHIQHLDDHAPLLHLVHHVSQLHELSSMRHLTHRLGVVSEARGSSLTLSPVDADTVCCNADYGDLTISSVMNVLAMRKEVHPLLYMPPCPLPMAKWGCKVHVHLSNSSDQETLRRFEAITSTTTKLSRDRWITILEDMETGDWMSVETANGKLYIVGDSENTLPFVGASLHQTISLRRLLLVNTATYDGITSLDDIAKLVRLATLRGMESFRRC